MIKNEAVIAKGCINSHIYIKQLQPPVHQFIHPNVQPAASQLQFNQPPKTVPNQLGQLNPTQVLFIFLFTNLAFADRVKIKKYVKNE